MANNEQIKVNIDFKTNASEATQGVNNLGGALKNLNNQGKETEKVFDDVNKTFEEVYGDLQPLTTRMGEAEDRLYELGLAGKQSSKEFQSLLETVARYRSTQIETDRVVDAAATTHRQKLAGGLEVAAAATQGLVAGLALIGIESEDTTKALLKVQSAMAFADSISKIAEMGAKWTQFSSLVTTSLTKIFGAKTADVAITEAQGVATVSTTVATEGATVATNAFTAALLRNPYTAIAVALVAVGTAIYGVIKYMGDGAEETRKLNVAIDSAKVKNDAYTKSVEDTATAQKETNSVEVARAKAMGKTSEEIDRIILKQKQATIEAQRAVVAYNQQAYTLASIRYSDAIASGDDTAVAKAKEAVQTAIDNIYEGNKAILAAKKEVIIQEAEIQEKANTKAKEKQDKANAEAKTQREQNTKDALAKKNKANELSKQIDESLETPAQKEEREYKEKLAVLTKNNLSTVNLEKQHRDNLLALENEYFAKESDAAVARDKTAKEKADAQTKAEMDYWTGQSDMATERDEAKKEKDDADIKAFKTKFAKQAQILADFGATFAEGSKEQDALVEASVQLDKIASDGKITNMEAVEAGLAVASKALGKASAAGKAVAVAEATINTFKAATSAYASLSGIPIVGPALGAAAAAAAVVAGVANVKKILAVKTPEGGGGSAGSSISASAPTTASAAPTTSFVSSSNNQLASSISNANKTTPPTKVYLTTGDVATANELNRKAVNTSTIG